MKKGDTAFYEGDKAKNLYIIIEGEVEVLKENIKRRNAEGYISE